MNGVESVVIVGVSGSSFKAWLKTAEGNKNSLQVVLQLTDGTQFLVPRDLLVPAGKGRFELSVNLRDYAKSTRAEASGDTVIPIVEETLQVSKRTVTRGVVKFSKRVVARQETVDIPLWQERIEVERVSANQVVGEAAPVRYEGDTMIVSLYEEVLVVRKQLRLVEEVRITTSRSERRDLQQITLRREEVELRRRAAKPND